MSRILAQVLPLISTCFSSHVSFRAINCLREVVPPQQFAQFFQEYGSYAELSKSMRYGKTNETYPIAGKLTYPESAAL